MCFSARWKRTKRHQYRGAFARIDVRFQPSMAAQYVSALWQYGADETKLLCQTDSVFSVLYKDKPDLCGGDFGVSP
jgi:hypothetical protein